MTPFNRLMTALSNPYNETDADLARPPAASEVVQATFCGT
jgi:hypothetical protein